MFSVPDYDGTTPISPWSINRELVENFPQNYFENMKANAQKAFHDEPGILDKVTNRINAAAEKNLFYYTNTGWGNISELFPILLVFMAVLVSILFASMYSGSYESGMSEVFACTRNGKTELAVSKAIVSIVISSALYLLVVGLFIGTNLLLYGGQGLQTSLVIQRPYLFVSGTIQDLLIAMVVIGFFAIVAQGCLSLFFSAVCRSSLSAVVFSLILAVAPFLLSLMMDKSNKLLYLLINILPSGGANGYFELIDNQYLQILDSFIWYPNLMWIAGNIWIIIFSGLSIVAYNRHWYKL